MRLRICAAASFLVTLAACAQTQAPAPQAAAAAPPAEQATAQPPLGFLERKNLPYPQSTPFPLPQTPADVREHNKQVVLDFYKVVSDHRLWTAEMRDKYFAPDFHQHDPAEPSTSAAFFDFFATMGGPPGKPGKRMMMMKMPGVTANDSNGSPVNWMVAEGDMVVVARHRNWPWPGGPEPVYNGIFVDIWRLQNGKITDQWCSCTPADAQTKRIMMLKQQGKFPKDPE